MKVRFGTPGISPTTVWMTGLPSRGCKIGVWIDGARQYPNGEDAITVGELIERIHPLHIEMIEVYRGPAEMPAEFLDDSCAAIAIWTR